ncbi:hypothetical protein [Chromatium okenii]|jgi:hypothetical protein|uniref:hypothetical protein n=1 Tax=Chromatium okenii TaxID=61644 RepID=UPI0026EADA09|nr:hypothetical protein [Chromatium okenii]MBV5308509.1 hypothetical protein [Chromatium okenii]
MSKSFVAAVVTFMAIFAVVSIWMYIWILDCTLEEFAIVSIISYALGWLWILALRAINDEPNLNVQTIGVETLYIVAFAAAFGINGFLLSVSTTLFTRGVTMLQHKLYPNA